MMYRGIEIERVPSTGYVRRGRWHVPGPCWVVYAGTDKERAFTLLRYAKAQVDIDLDAKETSDWIATLES